MAEIKTGIIINARTNQGRWPDKILTDLGGKPVVEQTMIRAKQVTEADYIILAGTYLKEDLILCDMATKHDISWFPGDPEDVIYRDYTVCVKYDLDYYIAIPASWPMFSASGANEKIIVAKQHPGFDEYCTIDFPIHAGLFVHLSSVKMLKRLVEKPDRPKRFEWIPDFPH
jgi:spore coat polysaccharide biosynthesis protein SpsF (cytidylyltransferase family)